MDYDDLLDVSAACRFIGGNRPIHPSTLWRGVRTGRFSRPLYIGPQNVRWWRAELAADLERMTRERDGDGIDAVRAR
jgi:predicted DNA-binding transcriptional regulator AlpA